jgi:hypothetical protein
VSAADATISELAAAQRASIANADCVASQESHRIASAVRLNGWRPAETQAGMLLAGQKIRLPDLFTKSAQPSIDVGYSAYRQNNRLGPARPRENATSGECLAEIRGNARA